MQIKRIPAARGRKWLLDGSDLFARSPISFLLFGLLLQLLTLLLAIPFIGVLIVLILPILVAGALAVTRQLDGGQQVSLGNFFALFFDDGVRRPLLTLGLINLLFGILASVVLASSLAVLAESNLLELLQSGDPEVLASVDLSPMFLLVLQLALVLGLVTALNFFAVPLVAFQGVRPVQAMVISFKACLVNWAPMLVYGFAIFVLFAVVSILLLLLATVVIMVFSGSTFGSQLMTMLTVPVLIAVQMILLCAQFLAYRDMFDPEPAAPAHGQLLA